jgi:tetratricopeptide (TPR) repeat protein
MFHGTAVLRAALLARAGELTQAAELVLAAVPAAPAAHYLEWLEGWLDQPHALQALDPETIERAAGTLCRGELGPDLGRRVAALLRLISDAHPSSAPLGFLACVQLRKAGQVQEAVDFGQARAYEWPSYQVFIALGGALRQVGELEAALDAFGGALRHARNEQDQVGAGLDIGDLLMELRRYDDAAKAYGRVLEVDPDEAWATASALYLRARGGDAQARQALLEAARAEPPSERASSLAVKIAPYEFGLPPRPESLIELAAAGIEKGNTLTAAAVSGFEAPSALRSIRAAWGKDVRIDVGSMPTPDPRDPRRPVPFTLWKFPYAGRFGRFGGKRAVEATPGVDPPEPEIASALARMASRPFSPDGWWQAADGIVREHGATRARDGALGSMVHWPPLGNDRMALWDWAFHVQVAAAFVLARLDERWPEGLRREALTAVLDGPVDWVGTAALVALTEIARREPEARADILSLVSERALSPHVSPITYMCWIEPAAQLVRRIPDRPPELDRRLAWVRQEMEID